MPFCAQCGRELDETAKFCIHCGEPVAPSEAVPGAPAAPEPTEPRAPTPSPTPPDRRVQGCLAVAAAVVLAVIAGFCSSDQNASNVSPSEPAATAEPTDVEDGASEEVPGVVAEDPESFREQWNEAADTFGQSQFRANVPFNVDEGEIQNVFQHQLTEQLVLQGTVNEADGSLREALILGQAGSLSRSTDIIAAMGMLILSANPGTPTERRGQVLRDLGLLDVGAGDLDDYEAETTLGGNEYWFQSSSVVGIFFGVRQAGDG